MHEHDWWQRGIGRDGGRVEAREGFGDEGDEAHRVK
jgi:hypothetical protein